jgi:hypothetical protein
VGAVGNIISQYKKGEQEEAPLFDSNLIFVSVVSSQ